MNNVIMKNDMNMNNMNNGSSKSRTQQSIKLFQSPNDALNMLMPKFDKLGIYEVSAGNK